MRTEIRIALHTRNFFIAVAATILVLCVGAFRPLFSVFTSGQSLYPGQHQMELLNALSSSAILLCAPICCAFPYAAAFIDEYKSGFYLHCLPRTTLGTYLKNKCFACACSGGLALLCGALLFSILLALLLTPMELAPTEDMPSQTQTLALMGRYVLFFLNGAFWANAGMCLSALTMNRYMALASPFILFYVLVIFAERYFLDLYVLNPKNWLTGNGNWSGSTWGLSLFLIVWILVISLAFYFLAERRLLHA